MCMHPECVCMALRNVLGEHAYNFVVACPTINIILATPLNLAVVSYPDPNFTAADRLHHLYVKSGSGKVLYTLQSLY